MEEEKEGMSFGDIIRIIFSQKWLALILVAVITIAGTLGLYFGYSLGKEEYTRSFSIKFPGIEAANPVYPDKTPFEYRSLVTPERLAEIKEQNTDLAYLDLGKMYNRSEISISRTVGVPDATGETDVIYTVKVRAREFKSDAHAQALIDAIAQYPVNYVKGLAADRDIYLASYSDELYLEDRFELLAQQKDYLLDKISELNEVMGNSSARTKLVTELNDLSRSLEAARGTMTSNHYVHDVDKVKSDYTSMIVSMTRERDAKLQALKYSYGNFTEGGAGSDNIQPTETMVQLSEEISRLESDIKLYNEYIEQAQPASEQFLAELKGLYDSLVQITADYEGELSQYYGATSAIAYDGGMTKTGGLGIILCVVISLIAGIIVAAVVAYIVGVQKLRNTAEHGSASASAPAADGPADGEH